jgi:hypothetical protein
MNTLRTVALTLALLASWIVAVYHLGSFAPPPPAARTARAAVVAQSRFLDRGESAINHLLLFGTPYERGLATSRLTKTMLDAEEAMLDEELRRFFPSAVTRWALRLFAMRWFSGIEAHLPPDALAEMYGVAQHANPRWNHLADPYTRQVAYHGVHEVGQMFVDFEKEGFGCTLLGVPFRGSWLLGRNFDFEAVRFFDTEKIAKWVFPERGHAYVSVIWAGMVGAVTGVNARGVYVSINAAGTTDFRRLGTPTTLIATRVLEEASSADEAVRIIVDTPAMISEIFVVADPTATAFYVVEKTPERAQVIRHERAAAVANHLQASSFVDDPINRFRRENQTSLARQERGDELVAAWDRTLTDPVAAATAMVTMLRDKRAKGGQPLHLGHRGALDALIATHSVVYDAAGGHLWISRGPALTGAYLGFDLRASFAAKAPVAVGSLPADEEVDSETFAAYQSGMQTLREAKAALAEQACARTAAQLGEVEATPARDHYEYLMLAGDYQARCRADGAEARALWRRSLAASPAYRQHRERLAEALR